MSAEYYSFGSLALYEVYSGHSYVYSNQGNYFVESFSLHNTIENSHFYTTPITLSLDNIKICVTEELPEISIVTQDAARKIISGF